MAALDCEKHNSFSLTSRKNLITVTTIVSWNQSELWELVWQVWWVARTKGDHTPQLHIDLGCFGGLPVVEEGLIFTIQGGLACAPKHMR